MSVLFLDASPLCNAVSLVAKVANLSGLQVVTVDDTVRSSDSFKKASPQGNLPALSGTESVAGFSNVVKALLPKESPLFGGQDSKNVDKYLAFVEGTLLPSLVNPDAKTAGNLKKVNKDLSDRIFYSGLSLTLADVLLFAALQNTVRGWRLEERNAHNHLTRYVDFIQHQDGIVDNGFISTFNVVQDFTATPTTAAPEKKVDGKTEAGAESKPAAAEAKGKGQQQKKPEGAADKKTERKEPTAEEKEAAKKAKEDRKAKNASRGGAPAEPKKELPVDVSRLDMRVGKIVDVKKHPDADALYVEQIDLGEEKPRQVVSGLVKFVPIEEMKDRMCVVLCNLKPSALRGVSSTAMVMCASNDDHTKVELLTPPEGTAVGERVTAAEYPGQPDEQLNPKQKVFEAVAVDLKTNGEDTPQATYKGALLKVSKGVVTVKSIKSGLIK
eukprot:TRINITY_DN15041_c0_g1_i1.p1 TRINITY_DN15041_c0_g1~~TRINITY_DN15041_c0_g1_i1.p1  ORF type:complete len:441 (+),score=205.49 TRINITY_DN15041_c0_g1_i1:88-1410(+)